MQMRTTAPQAGSVATRATATVAVSADQWLDQVLRAHCVDGRDDAAEIVALLASPTTAAANALATRLPEIAASNLKLRILLRGPEDGSSLIGDENAFATEVGAGPFAPTCAKTVARGRVAHAHEFMVLGRDRGWLGPSMAQASERRNVDGRDLTEAAHVGLAWLAFEAIEAGAESFEAGQLD